MTPRSGRPVDSWCHVLGLVLALVTPLRAEWHVSDAPIRFTIRLEKGPSHPQAGYFLHVPDGGALPSPAPVPAVFSERGSPLTSATLWHSPGGGMGLVFQTPPRGTKHVLVYLRRGTRLQLWTPATGLHPSAILCADPTTASLVAARKLAELGTVGPTVHYRNVIGHRRAPFSIGGDHSGRPRPCSFYYLTHVATTDPGRTWIAPFVQEGDCRVLVNGQELALARRIDKWGGTGAWADLPAGLNRIEVLQTAPGTGPQRAPSGLMYLTWRTPQATMAELGGVRSDRVPMSGTSRMETRVVQAQEMVRSGRCRIERVHTSDDGPLAVPVARPGYVFWSGEETPVVQYTLDVISSETPAPVRYDWALGTRGVKPAGAPLTWLFAGNQEQVIEVMSTAGGKRATVQLPFFAHTLTRTRLSDQAAREAFLQASYTMFQSSPAHVDPTAPCGSAYWNNLMRVVTVDEGYELLVELLTHREPLLKARLQKNDQALLQDIVLDAAPRRDPAKALEWIRARRRSRPGGTSAAPLILAEAEVMMHYLGQTNGVARLLTPLLRHSGDAPELARVRLGDLALLAGDLNGAAAQYAGVQKRVRHHRNAAGDDRREARGQLKRPKRVNRTVDNWKLNAFLGVSISETVKSLLDQGQLLGARETLQAWERQFPLSKISGDFVLQEARYYMRLRDWRRARSMLAAYIDHVDASSFLPGAAVALLDCMDNMGDSPDDIRAFCEKMAGKLEFHPSGAVFRERLETGGES